MSRIFQQSFGTGARPRDRKRSPGFTLIELMIVVAIIAILAAIAIPSYTQYVLKGRRAEGRGALMNLMQQEEAYITQNGTYAAFVAGDASAPLRAYSNDNADSSTAAYALGARACSAPNSTDIKACIEVFADPVIPDPKVKQLTLDSTGKRDCSGTDASLCW